ADVDARWDSLLHTCCVHVLHFFTTRSTFAARARVEQTRMLHRLATTTDLLMERLGDRHAEDAAFERRWADRVIARHGELTIHGLDIGHGHEWPLDAAYVPLEVTTPETGPDSADPTAPAGAGGSGGSVDPSGLVLRAEDALAGRERVLLRGVAGSGKSTLVQWLAVTAARTHLGPPRDHPPGLDHLVGRVPFVLPLRRVGVDGRPPTPDRFAHAVGSPLAAAQPDGWADRVLTAGRALLLVDGVDEVPERDRETVRRWIRDLMAADPGNPWVVTARPSAVREDWLADRVAARGFAELSLAPMSRTDIELFVTRWHRAADADPGMRRRVTDTAARLLPPADLRQARFLAHHGGTLLLGLLPGPEGLTDDEAGAVVVTALRIGTDAALPLLARYRHHPSLWLRRQLAWNWHHFDAERYAREILADLDEEDLYVSVHTPKHLRLLRGLGGRARVQLVGTHRPEELITLLVPERLTHLWWRNLPAPGDDGAWTADFPYLREIRVRRAAVAEGWRCPWGSSPRT
ncbi:NACHT domain-containing protein, partial [Streptomyces alkaliphilus]